MTEILENGYQLSPQSVLMYQADPVAFAEDQLNITPYPEQAELLQAVIGERKDTAWRSGHGSGKSSGVGMLVLEWLYLFPNARVVVTAPKAAQIKDAIWAELSTLIRNSNLADDFTWYQTKVVLKGREQQSFAVARTANSPEAAAGQHAENMLRIFDEASGISMEIFEATEGSQTTKGSVTVLIGNPTQTQGYFFDAFHRDRTLWHHIVTSVEDHPNVDRAWVEKMARRWNIDSDVYRVRVLGDFPIGDPNTFITLSRVEAAMARDVKPEGPIELGVDVARFGDDRTIVLGRQGLHLFKDHVRLGRSSVPETIGATLKFLRDLRNSVGYEGDALIKVDDSGVGGGVTDGLRLAAEKQGFEVVACNFGGAGDKDYDDEATIMWAAVRDLIDQMELPDLEDMVGEISLRRYGMTPAGKIKIEPKKIFKDRVGMSPDYADALVLCFASGVRRIKGDFESVVSTTDWG